jgi:beta-glucosidase
MGKVKINKGIIMCLLLSLLLILISVMGFAEDSKGTKYTAEQSKDGFIIVYNEDGPRLTYSPQSGLKILTIDGYAFKDLNKNGKLDPYEDWRLGDKARAEDLASKLSIPDIAGLMLYSSHQTNITPEVSEEQKKFLQEDGVRAVLNAAGNNVEVAAKWNNSVQAFVEGIGFGIPVNFSSDPRHTASSARSGEAGGGDISLWPTNLGLAATFDPVIVKEFGRIASKEYRAMGIGTALSPQIDLATEPRWLRVNGTFGEDPALARDMTKAYTDGFQSTFDEKGKDLGWGQDSVNAMIKHWPGDGAGEGGRESHSETGKYAVYPGGQFETHLIPFVDGGFNLDGETEAASAVMPSYSIAWDDEGAFGEHVSSGYSEYKIKKLLRGKYSYDGVVCTDWMITSHMTWGVDNLTVAERHYKALMAGVDQFGGNNEKGPVIEAYEIGIAKIGEVAIRHRFEESAVRLLKNIFRIGLFEDPYLEVEESKSIVGKPEHMKKGYEAQLKSIVLLKNRNNMIKQAADNRQKPTVYIPMGFTPAEKVMFGPVDAYTPASWNLPVNREIAEQYFKVITDQIGAPTGIDHKGNPQFTAEDILRPTAEELKEIDFTLAVVNSPKNAGNMFAGTGVEDGKYIPLSLQYGEYTADSKYVRKQSIAARGGENRSYYGETAKITNKTDLDSILYAKENANGKPIIVAIRADNPMVLQEFEKDVDVIVMGFGVTDQAYFDIITGKVEPEGLLPIQMPANMDAVEKQAEDVPRDLECYMDKMGNKYDFAFGLNWSGVIRDERTEKYQVPPLTAPANKGN